MMNLLKMFKRKKVDPRKLTPEDAKCKPCHGTGNYNVKDSNGSPTGKMIWCPWCNGNGGGEGSVAFDHEGELQIFRNGKWEDM